MNLQIWSGKCLHSPERKKKKTSSFQCRTISQLSASIVLISSGAGFGQGDWPQVLTYVQCGFTSSALFKLWQRLDEFLHRLQVADGLEGREGMSRVWFYSGSSPTAGQHGNFIPTFASDLRVTHTSEIGIKVCAFQFPKGVDSISLLILSQWYCGWVEGSRPLSFGSSRLSEGLPRSQLTSRGLARVDANWNNVSLRSCRGRITRKTSALLGAGHGQELLAPPSVAHRGFPLASWEQVGMWLCNTDRVDVQMWRQ